jgi:O-antigen biosynthesis protein
MVRIIDQIIAALKKNQRSRIVALLNKNQTARKLYGIYAKIQRQNVFSIPDIMPISARKSKYDFERINLLLPSINREHFFGGAYTALKLFDEITKKVTADCRIRLIITNASPNKEALEKFRRYQLLSADEDNDAEKQLIVLNNYEKQNVFVTKNDKFIASAWWTAYRSQHIIEQQIKLYGQNYYKMVYIIQDYEPGFYNWSSYFALAESTYQSKIPTIAVFNSSLLKDFFNERSYVFFKDYFFEPKFNEYLKQCIDRNNGQRKKKIIIYGRPSVDRNCFPLIIEALREWVLLQPIPGDWQLTSVGETHPAIDLGNGIILKSVGKLSLQEYAHLLSESAIGVSFMVSPHPSYPPLEMAHSGLLTLTNSYANKNLSKFHENVTSLQMLSPNAIAEALLILTNRFVTDSTVGLRGKSYMPHYTDSSYQFPFLDDLIAAFMSKS